MKGLFCYSTFTYLGSKPPDHFFIPSIVPFLLMFPGPTTLLFHTYALTLHLRLIRKLVFPGHKTSAEPKHCLISGPCNALPACSENLGRPTVHVPSLLCCRAGGTPLATWPGKQSSGFGDRQPRLKPTSLLILTLDQQLTDAESQFYSLEWEGRITSPLQVGRLSEITCEKSIVIIENKHISLFFLGY